jgi:hypothetical protein
LGQRTSGLTRPVTSLKEIHVMISMTGQEKVTFKYRWLHNRGNCIGRFDCKICFYQYRKQLIRFFAPIVVDDNFAVPVMLSNIWCLKYNMRQVQPETLPKNSNFVLFCISSFFSLHWSLYLLLVYCLYWRLFRSRDQSYASCGLFK